MKNNDYIYNLVFKNKEGKDITSIPLSYNTPIDLKMPNLKSKINLMPFPILPAPWQLTLKQKSRELSRIFFLK